MSAISNKTYGKLYIEKKSVNEWLVFLILVLPFAFGLLVEVLNIPSFIRFSLDFFLACLCVTLLFNKYVDLKQNVKPLLILVLAFLVYTLIVYCFNFQSPFYYLWGVRNNFRFYVAFFAFVAYVRQDMATNWLKLLDVLFWINFVVSLVQFIFMDVRQDYLGGIFGISGGTNGYTLLFFCIIISKSLLATFNGTEKTIHCVLKCVSSLLVAAMAEMKFYYFVFILIFVIAAALTRFSKSKFILLFFCIIGIVIGATLLEYWFGSEDFLSFDSILNAATKENYSSNDDLNRLSAIYVLARDYITDFVQQLFGLGLGNCDTSELAIFNSTFYQNYSFLHYTWFTAAMLFLETGIMGLIFYISFFVFCFRYSHRQIKEKIGNKLFCQMAIVMSVICIIIMFYNSSLRIEAGYMAYFILALPFIPCEEGRIVPFNSHRESGRYKRR